MTMSDLRTCQDLLWQHVPDMPGPGLTAVAGTRSRLANGTLGLGQYSAAWLVRPKGWGCRDSLGDIGFDDELMTHAFEQWLLQ